MVRMLKTFRWYQLVVFTAAAMAVLASAFTWQAGAFAWQTGSTTRSSPPKATRPAGQKGALMVRVRVFNRAGELVGPLEVPKLSLTAAEWKKRLKPEQFKILR